MGRPFEHTYIDILIKTLQSPNSLASDDDLPPSFMKNSRAVGPGGGDDVDRVS